MTVRTPVQRRWEVNGLTLEGLCWGDESLPPLLALHGWLDNAASFSVLAPLLTSHHVVAIDLTGHGRSSRRSDDATYQIWDDLPEIMGAIEQLGWQAFDLMGHSRGAIIGTILASAIPERVNHLVLLDAVTPQAIPEEDFPKQMARFLKDKPRRLNKPGRVYATAKEAIAARTKNGLSDPAAQALASRGLAEHSQGMRWASDPRLFGASAVKLTEGQNRAILGNLTMPTLLLQAENGLAQHSSALEYATEHIDNLCAEIVPGGHHFHMEKNVAIIAQRIMGFLSSEIL